MKFERTTLGNRKYKKNLKRMTDKYGRTIASYMQMEKSIFQITNKSENKFYKRTTTQQIQDIQDNRGCLILLKGHIRGHKSKLTSKNIFKDAKSVNKIKYNIQRRQKNHIYWTNQINIKEKELRWLMNIKSYKRFIKKYIKISHKKHLKTKENKRKVLFKMKKCFFINHMLYIHLNQVNLLPQIQKCYKQKLTIWKKH